MAELTELEQVLPQEIEKRSFEIITQELGDRVLDEKQAPVILTMQTIWSFPLT